MLNKHRYLVYSYDKNERLFRVHFFGSLRACACLIDYQLKITGSKKVADIFKVMSASDFAQFQIIFGFKVEYPLNMRKEDLEEFKKDSENPLYSIGFSASDRFEHGE